MRISIFLLMVSCLSVSASAFGQYKVTLDVESVSVMDLFLEIQKKTDLFFVFNASDLEDFSEVSVRADNEEVGSVLGRVFGNTSLRFAYEGDVIVVMPAAQQQQPVRPSTVSGQVVDTGGRPVQGVAVLVSGTSIGTSTDAAGRYSVTFVASARSALEFSFIGMKRQVIPYTGQQTLRVVMEDDVTRVDQVVVVGYGSVHARDFTGSVSSVNSEELKDIPFMSIDAALAGKASGLSVIKADGAAGGAVRMRLRGGTSLKGANDPLYVIDGVPVMIENSYIESQSDVANTVEWANYGEQGMGNVGGSFMRGLNQLSSLNIADIETIDILKDASATAIYGSKAANGVVIITTRKGRRNTRPQLAANYYAGVATPKKESLLDAAQYAAMVTEACDNLIAEVDARLADGRITSPPAIYNDAKAKKAMMAELDGTDTDWLDLILRNAFTQSGDISVSGGGENSSYYTSVSYTSQQGVVRNSGFDRVSGKVNLDSEIRPWLSINTNLNYGYTHNDITGGAYAMALSAPPIFPVRNDDGTYAIMGELQNSYMGYQNPAALLEISNAARTWNLMGTFGLEARLLNDFRLRSNVAINYISYTQSQYTPSFVDVSGFYGREATGGGLGSQLQTNSVNTFFENTLSWSKTLGEIHRLDAVAGTSWENYRSSFFSATGRGYPDDYIMNNLSSALTPVAVKGSDPKDENSMLSFFGRANYVLRDRYLFTFTFRSDASSKFGPDNRWGLFPSGAVAWRIAEEGFMEGVGWVDELKLRASTGRTGTQSIGDHMWRTLATPTSYAGAAALIPSQLGNVNIGWESTSQTDVGLDFALFDHRLTGTLGWYNKQTDGALLNMTPAPSSSYSTVVYNIADIRNRGVEIDLGADLWRGEKFRWNLALNMAFNRSMVTDIGGNPFSDPDDRDNLNLGTSVVKEGSPLGLLYGRRVDGIIQNGEQLAAMLAGSALAPLMYPRHGLGDVNYLWGEDGYFSMDIIGNAEPKFFGGFTSNWALGDWSLLATFTYSCGNELIYQNSVASMGMNTMANRSTMVLDRWTPENPSNAQARNLWGATNMLTNLNVFDASYLKLKSLTLNYNVPQSFCRRAGVDRASVYVAATNLFTLTRYPGPDPEVSDDPGSVIGGGRDISSYPTTRSWSMGFRLSF